MICTKCMHQAKQGIVRLPRSRAQAAYVVKLVPGWLRLLSTRLSPICTSRGRCQGARTPRHRPGQGCRAAARAVHAVHDRHPHYAVCHVMPPGSANMHSSRISVCISASARILASVSWLGPNSCWQLSWHLLAMLQVHVHGRLRCSRHDALAWCILRLAHAWLYPGITWGPPPAGAA